MTLHCEDTPLGGFSWTGVLDAVHFWEHCIIWFFVTWLFCEVVLEISYAALWNLPTGLGAS